MQCFVPNNPNRKGKISNVFSDVYPSVTKLPVIFCQRRVEVTSCFVYKVMGLTIVPTKSDSHVIFCLQLPSI